jgi:hypothetical protein
MALALAATAALGCTTTSALAIEVGPTVSLDARTSRLDVTLANKGRVPAKRVALRCQFYDAEGQMQTGSVFFTNLKAGDSATNPIIVPSGGVTRGECAIAAKAVRR